MAKPDYSSIPDASLAQLISALRDGGLGGGPDRDLLRLLVEHLPDHVQLISPEGIILFNNRPMGGHSAEQAIGSHISEYVHPDAKEASRESLQRCLESREIQEYKLPLAPRNSAPRWVTVRLVPVCKGDSVSHVIAIGRDITAEHEHEEQLRASEQRLAMVFQASPLAAVILDLEMRINEWNPAAEKLFGYSRDEALGKGLEELIIPEQNRDSIRERYKAAVEGRYGIGKARNINITRYSERITCNWFSTPLYDREGKIEAIASLGQDITQQIHAEEALAEAMRAAEVSARAKSQFLANMSHEIRTPMHGILGASELMLRNSLPDEVREDLELIHKSATALLAIVDDVLDFSKLEADSVRLHKAPVDISDLLRDTFELLRPLAESKGLQYSLNQARDEPCVVQTDPARLRQILNNLISNAIKFTERGFVHVEQNWHHRNGFTHLLITVRDSGPGIAAEQIPNVFDDFYQADASWTRNYGGTGLGLAISQRLAEMLGGKIKLESELGQGSNFSVELCMESAQPLPPPPSDEQGRLRFHAQALLVDDNPVNLAVGEKLLRYLGLAVDTARNGHKALALAHQREYDIIFMDIQMPDMDGLTTCRQLRAEGCEVPVVAVTADAQPEDQERCLDAGMLAVLTKPFRSTDVAGVLQRILPQPATEPPATNP